MARITRPVEERVAEIDEKIDFCNAKIFYYQNKIKELNSKRNYLLHPETRLTITQIVKRAKESGLTTEEIAAKLGIKLK